MQKKTFEWYIEIRSRLWYNIGVTLNVHPHVQLDAVQTALLLIAEAYPPIGAEPRYTEG